MTAEEAKAKAIEEEADVDDNEDDEEGAPQPRKRRRPKDKTAAPAPNGTAQPWVGFNRVPDNARISAPSALPGERSLIPAAGHARFICLRNCGNGKYAKGRIYVLPEKQDGNLFRKMQ